MYKEKKKKTKLVNVLRTLVVGICLVFGSVAGVHAATDLRIDDENPTAMPAVGSYGLRILSPTMLELTLISTKSPDPATVTNWNFVSNGSLSAPAVSEFTVTANGNAISVTSVGFKRRPLYAPLNYRDLRIGNHLYLQLGTAIADGQTVTVKNSSGRLWGADKNYTAVADPLRFNPAIHVNQEGYMPTYTKEAMVGYYMGSKNELAVPSTTFKLVDANSGAVVYTGTMTVRKDVGYTTTPVPYQWVYEADFTAFQTPGEYRLQVPGMGASLAFQINEGIAALYARSYALGLYHQRCGYANDYPYTRHQKGACHVANAVVPDMTFSAVNAELANMTADYASHQAAGTPQLKDVNSSLYPFVNKNPIPVRGGHHDAGDYSKYTINIAQLAHSLMFAVDSLPGVAALDNLGLPESGDGISDVMQEARWELDFLANLQDTDGGFYFLVYPRNREYEDNVSLQGTDLGDSQVVFPKTTHVTAASVAALAQAASSPKFKAAYPTAAANYLAKAKLGWQFLENAWAKYGRAGAFQKITHYGVEFKDADEIAWAACEMYLATGESKYHTELMNNFDPSNPDTRRWTWWRLFEGYGCAIRSYAFAARSGRTVALNSTYLSKCQAEIIAAGDDQVNYYKANAYGNCFPNPNKPYRSAGWFMSGEQTYDLATAYQLSAKADYINAVLGAMGFDGGCNPVNMCFLTGIGWKRQRETVNQYAENDRRILPPSGIPLGSVWSSEPYIWQYNNELRSLVYPIDDTTSNMYAPYDKWTDTFNTSTEMVNPQQGHALAAMAWFMAQTPLKSQAWKSAAGTITGLPSSIPAQEEITATLSAPGVDLSNAMIMWEARDQEPTPADRFTFACKNTGPQWVEAEALLPDGRRVFATTTINATTATNTPSNSYQSASLSTTTDMVALYHLDNNGNDAMGQQPALSLQGGANYDTSNLGWMQNRTGGNLRFAAIGDKATVQIPAADTWASDTTAITVEAMVYVNQYLGYNKANLPLVSLVHNWASSLEFFEDMYAGPVFKGGAAFNLSGSAVQNALTKNVWHHMRMTIDKSGYTIQIDGKTIGTLASSDFQYWNIQVPSTLTLGNFDGWVDEVVIRNVRPGTGGSTGGSSGDTITVPAPEITPNGGTFTNWVNVSISATNGATVRYTLDGSTPTSSSLLYSGVFTLQTNRTVKAIAFLNSGSSLMSSATFNIVSGSTGGGSDTNTNNAGTVKAAFVTSDTTTLGNWKSVYGGEGYNVIGNSVKYPTYASVSAIGQSDWLWQASTTDQNGLLKVGSTTDRILSIWYAAESFTVDINVTDDNAHRFGVYAYDWDNLGRSQRVEIIDPATDAVLSTMTMSSFTTGRYLVWDIAGKVRLRVTRLAGPNCIINGLFFGAVPGTTPPANVDPTVTLTSPTANSTFTSGTSVTLNATAADTDGTVSKVEFYSGSTKLGEDTTTPYSYTWSNVAAGSYSLTAKTTDNDGAVTTSAAVPVTVKAPAVVVATPTFSPAGGTYTNSVKVMLACATSGATIRYTTDGTTPTSVSTAYSAPFSLVSSKTVKAVAFYSGTSSAVASAAYTVVASTTTTSGNRATFVKSDTTTLGNWKGVYGIEGYNVLGDSAKYPAYSTVWAGGKSDWLWGSSTTDARALLKASTTGRALGLWYAGSTFTVNVNINDGKAHRLGLYFLDWDKLGRAQKVEILDATTGAVLNTQTISGFGSGRYLVWQISGKVKVRITRTGGPNCILNGLFFDAAPAPTT